MNYHSSNGNRANLHNFVSDQDVYDPNLQENSAKILINIESNQTALLKSFLKFYC